ncbi:chromosome organization and biogenesis-related protein [Kockovaella imperatae]|uniref:Ribosome biogenesis protein YTM1 n=1 Tax=Kockovaella imperatae TaxID=4999 RepID=A0A1Y1UG71_9TREE|nr:chromosome organization and biogenesis-related protein [Kockovaella imperatae]ORX37061.1 chromosome organization and biogenesis-related protein [Kockovaella imperatae]
MSAQSNSAGQTSNEAGPSASGANGSGPRQLAISLITRSPTDAIPSSTYFIPASWKRYQLSELINKVLKYPTPVPFDFLINGQVLRGSLEAWVQRNRGGDEEGTIDVEYVRSLMPPEEVGRVEMEDWVSGLSLARSGHILVSSYLSHVQILPLTLDAGSAFDAATHTLPLPTTLGATCCTWLSPPSATTNLRLAAGGVDRAVHVFTLPSLDPSSSTSGRELFTLMGHTGPISSISSSSSGRELVSASWDGNLHLYIMPEDEPTEHQLPSDPTTYLPGQKRRKKMKEERGPIEGLTDGDIGTEGWRRAPELIMRGHKGRIGSVAWDKQDTNKTWSGGWDGSVRGWDMETGACTVVRQGSADKSILAMDQWASNGTIATGSMDRTICLWDTREASSLISLTMPTTSPVASLTCHPTSQYTLCTATYSGAVQIWDVRSPKNALFSFRKQRKNAGSAEKERKFNEKGKVFGERLLACDWDGKVVVAGGEDGEVGIWRASG